MHSGGIREALIIWAGSCIVLASMHRVDGMAVVKPTEAVHNLDHEDVDVLQHMLSLSPNVGDEVTGILLSPQAPMGLPLPDGHSKPPGLPGLELAPESEALHLAIGPTLPTDRLQVPDNSVPQKVSAEVRSASSTVTEIEAEEKQKDPHTAAQTQKSASVDKGPVPVDDLEHIISQETPETAASTDVLAVATEETPEKMKKLVMDAARKAGYCKAASCTPEELTRWAEETAVLGSAARLIASEASASPALASAGPVLPTMAQRPINRDQAQRLIDRDEVGTKHAEAAKDDDVDVLQHMLSLSPIADEQSSGTPIVDDQSRGPQRQNQRTTPQASTDAPRSLREGAITEWAHARIDDIQTIASTWVGVQKEGEQNELFLIIGIVSGAVIFGVLGVLIGMVTHRVYRLRKKRQRDMAKAMDQSNHVLQPPAAPLKKGPSKGDL